MLKTIFLLLIVVFALLIIQLVTVVNKEREEKSTREKFEADIKAVADKLKE